MNKKRAILLISLFVQIASASEPQSLKRDFESTSSEADTSSAKADTSKKSRSIKQCSLLATPSDDIIEQIVQDIQSIGSTGYIGIETPSLSNQRIIDTLKTVAQNKPQVKIRIFVNDPKQENNPKLAEIYQNLNIPINIVKGLHSKRILIAKEFPLKPNQTVIYLGSLNMTETSPKNHEIMMRCYDDDLFNISYQDQHRLEHPYYFPTLNPSFFETRSIMQSSSSEAYYTKQKIIDEFSSCKGDDDYLYLASFTLDDSRIINSLIRAKKRSNKPIKVIVDGKFLRKRDTTSRRQRTLLRKLKSNRVEVYTYNKDGKVKVGPFDKIFHIKAILRICNGKCTSLISTANFTVQDTIDHDVWQPCSGEFATKLKEILDEIMSDSATHQL